MKAFSAERDGGDRYSRTYYDRQRLEKNDIDSSLRAEDRDLSGYRHPEAFE